MTVETPPEPNPNAPTPPDTTPSTKTLWAETLILWALSCLMLVFVTLLGQLHPFLYENSQVLAAAFFLHAPIWWLERKRLDLADFGLHTHHRRRCLIIAALTCAVIFPLFALGYHVFQTGFQQRSLQFDQRVFHRWSHTVEERPKVLPPPTPFALWEEQDNITLVWTKPPAGQTVHARLEADAPFGAVLAAEVNNGGLFVRSLNKIRTAPRWIAPHIVDVKTSGPGGVRVSAKDVTSLKVEIWRGDTPIDPGDIGLGVQSSHPSTTTPLTVSRDYWWLLALVLTHLLLVAIPEEVFFRGFLQTRLDQLLPPRFHFLGAPLGLGVVLTSALFAISHYIVELDPNRLIVFFPSLLFGWLRNLTGGVMSAVIVHGFSNVLLLLLARSYV